MELNNQLISIANISNCVCMCVMEECDNSEVDEQSEDTTELSVSKRQPVTVRSLT